MKRRCEDDDEGEEAQRKRRALASAGGGAAEQRSGVVTVAAAAAAADEFKPTPLHPSRPTTPTPTLARFATQPMTEESPASCALDVTKRMLGQAGGLEMWEEECGVMVNLFYHALLQPLHIDRVLLRGFMADFIRKWCEEIEGEDMNALFEARHERRKCAAFTTLALLHANLLPDDSIPLEKLRTLPLDSKWDGGLTIPAGMLDICKDSLFPLNNFLLLSAEVLKCGWQGRRAGAGNTYIGVLGSFLQAVGLYRKEDFTGSLQVLEAIPRHLCGSELEGCVLWLTGLGLAKLGKPHTALLKLEAAVKACEACLPAVFNISCIFHQTDMVTAELECLALLAAGKEEKSESAVPNLQAALLGLYQTRPADLQMRAQYLLAARCLQMKMHKEASNKFSYLLEKLEDSAIKSSTAKGSVWLQSEDQVPEVPCKESVIVQAAIAHLGEQNIHSALEILQQIDSEDLEHEKCDAYGKEGREKLRIFTTAAGCLTKIDTLVKLGKEMEALKVCVRLDQALSWVRYAKVLENKGWELVGVMLKALLYSWLAYLHGVKKSKQSQCHYQRRATQNCRMLLDAPSSPACSELTLTESLALNNVYSYLTSKLQDLSAK
ncbi:uncharacterized protein LOC134786278 isoform X1 [Penaeus indicus]|uniref:uncharacterized protein LOC134786278 isoform X1 n=1 Tax=Penaeus indicus TaxID=29960 RepID=UPI00300D2726